MAKGPSVQYVHYYTDGSAARKLEVYVPEKKAAPVPKVHKQKRKAVYIDPVATLGIVVAVALLVMMAVGVFQLKSAQADARAMERYVAQLTQQNAELSSEYAAGYDLTEVEQTALALGMVPESQVPSIMIDISEPVIQTEPSFWERAGTFLAGLFA